jgi:hypothetical protein
MMSISAFSANSLPTMDASYGAEILSVSLAKRQQVMEGQAAIALLESAASVAPASSSNSRLGSNINITV